MSISSSMYVALTGMHMSQAAMDVASHNIANVNTPGYSRQRINLSTLPTQNRSFGQLGLGVDADNISRYHDQFLTRSLIMHGSTLGHHVALKTAMDDLEVFYNESAGNGINSAMNDFFASWDQLADEANNRPNREELSQYTQSLVTQLALRRQDMDAMRLDTNTRIDDGVKEVNRLLADLANLNKQITVDEDPAMNRSANDLRDSREELTRQLAEFMDIEFYEDPQDGQWSITSPHGIPLVLKDKSFPLVTNTDSAGDVSIHSSHNDYWMEDITGSIKDGAIGGWLEFRDQELQEYYRQYDSFVDGLIFNINDQHAQGAGAALFSEAMGTTLVSNRSYLEVDFPGDDNNIRLSSLVSHLAAREPYDPYSDPDNLTVRFVKDTKVGSEISSTVKFNEDPGIMKWEITITLPRDSNNNVTVTADELTKYINSERSPSYSDGVNYLPPRTSTWKIGDFIGAEGVANQGTTGRINISGPDLPQGQDNFLQLNRSLQYVTPQGHHLSFGKEYAELATTFKHTDNDVIFKAIDKGESGEDISVEYTDRDKNNNNINNQLEVSVTTDQEGKQHILVQLATDENGYVTSTAGDIVAAVNRHVTARTLVTAETPADQTGLGLVETMDRTYLDRSGYFQIVTYPEGDEPIFHKVVVNPTDTLNDVLKQIGDTFESGIPGLRIESVTDRHGMDSLRIIADDHVQFGFAGDSSGALAVLGFNTILTGHNGADIGVNQFIVNNRDYLNAGHIDSNGNILEGDNTNALDMADVKDLRFSFYHQDSATLGTEFNSIYANIGANTQAATRDYDFELGIYGQLQDRQDAIAGVNLDEELADVLRYQYMYQASAKMISTIDGMMETLLAIR